MIPANPVILLAVPLILALAALCAAALFYDLTTFRRRKSSSETVYRCEECRHIYAFPHRIPLARCPQCGKQNEPVRE